MQGLVIKSTGSWYTVQISNGEIVECRLKGKLRMQGSKQTNVLAVGDWVDLVTDNDGNKLITAVQERRNHIIRRSTNLSKQSHVLAANLDNAMLICTVSNPKTSTGFIDRFLITAEAYGIPAQLVINKMDAYTSSDLAEVKQLEKTYGSFYPVFKVSVKEGQGIDQLLAFLKDSTTLLAGHSGVGKTSLLNLLNPSLGMKTGELSQAHAKGMHTTTLAQLFELPNGGRVIDTPGIKELGMFNIKKEELHHFFPEMKRLLNQCKYNSCLHLTEPGCKVKEAVESGEIAQSRYATYLNIISGDELDLKYE